MGNMHTLGASYRLLEWRYGKQQEAPVAGVAIFSSGECLLRMRIQNINRCVQSSRFLFGKITVLHKDEADIAFQSVP